MKGSHAKTKKREIKGLKTTKYGTKISIIKSLTDGVFLVEAVGRYGNYTTICLKDDIR